MEQIGWKESSINELGIDFIGSSNFPIEDFG